MVPSYSKHIVVIMTTHHDKQKALQAFWDEEKAFVIKLLTILKTICNNISNVMDMINRFAGLTSMASSVVSVASMLPGIIIGPIGIFFQLLVMFSDDRINLASKLVNFFTMTGSSGTSIASLILHSVAFPLSMASASLSLINEGWGLGELLYRRYYKKDKTITTLEWFDKAQGVVLAGLSIAASALLITPAAPVAYLLLALIGLYKLADSFDYNPIKILFNIHKNTATQSIEGSTVKTQNTLTAGNTVKQCQTPAAVKMVEETQKVKTSKPRQTTSRFKPGFYSLPETPAAEMTTPTAEQKNRLS